MKLSSQAKKRLPMQIMIVLGVALLTYHSAADWFATRNHNAELSGYVDAVEQMPKANRDAELALARSYNEKMPQGPLRDPYAYDVNPEQEDAAFTDYTRLLEAAPSGVMGRLSYPAAGINLPIYHGTADSVLRSRRRTLVWFLLADRWRRHPLGAHLSFGAGECETVLGATCEDPRR